MDQVPPRSGSTSAPKTLPLSKRGRQHQSIAPSSPTSAAVRMSPIKPYAEIGCCVIGACLPPGRNIAPPPRDLASTVPPVQLPATSSYTRDDQDAPAHASVGDAARGLPPGSAVLGRSGARRPALRPAPPLRRRLEPGRSGGVHERLRARQRDLVRGGRTRPARLGPHPLPVRAPLRPRRRTRQPPLRGGRRPPPRRAPRPHDRAVRSLPRRQDHRQRPIYPGLRAPARGREDSPRPYVE